MQLQIWYQTFKSDFYMKESRGHSHFEQSAVKQTVGNQFFLTHILFACYRFLSPDCRQEWIIEYCQHQDSDCQRWWADAQTVHNHKQANKLPCSGQAFCKVAISVSLRKIPPNHLKSKAGWQECWCKMSPIDVMLGVEGCSWAELTVLNQYPVPAEQQRAGQTHRGVPDPSPHTPRPWSSTLWSIIWCYTLWILQMQCCWWRSSNNSFDATSSVFSETELPSDPRSSLYPRILVIIIIIIRIPCCNHLLQKKTHLHQLSPSTFVAL